MVFLLVMLIVSCSVNALINVSVDYALHTIPVGNPLHDGCILGVDVSSQNSLSVLQNVVRRLLILLAFEGVLNLVCDRLEITKLQPHCGSSRSWL